MVRLEERFAPFWSGISLAFPVALMPETNFWKWFGQSRPGMRR